MGRFSSLRDQGQRSCLLEIKQGDYVGGRQGVMMCPPQAGFLHKYGQKLNLLGRDRGDFCFVERKKEKGPFGIILCLIPFVAFSYENLCIQWISCSWLHITDPLQCFTESQTWTLATCLFVFNGLFGWLCIDHIAHNISNILDNGRYFWPLNYNFNCVCVCMCIICGYVVYLLI